MGRIKPSAAGEDNNPDPIHLVQAFDRCVNYPREQSGVQFLAQGLSRAADRWKVPMQEIVRLSLEYSPRCPTDADLMTIAGGIAEERQRAEAATHNQDAEWRKNYGKPEPFVADWDLKTVREEADRKHREMWTRLGQHFGIAYNNSNRWKDIPWTRIIQAMRDLGYELTPEQSRMIS